MSSKPSQLDRSDHSPDNTFKILINEEEAAKGDLLKDFTPPVNPPQEIDDPEDVKPSDWIDIAEIEDEEATKPDDWDEDAPLMIVDTEAVKPEDWLDNEPLEIADPDAEKPEEWDDEEDGDWIAATVPNPKCQEASGCGEWTPPKIRNPEYKGKWTRPMIPNPEYKGVWAPRKIPNPDYFVDEHPADFAPLGGVGIELWTMTEDILFDNIFIGHDEKQAKKFAEETYDIKRPIEMEAEGSVEEDDESAPEGLVDKIRFRIDEFVNLAKEDSPLGAVKAMPEVAGGIAAALFTFLAVLGSLLGLFGASKAAPKKQPVVVKRATVKTAPAPEAKIEEIKSDDELAAKKRTTRSTKE